MASDGCCTIWLLVASLDERCVSKIGNLFPHVVYIGLWISYHTVPIMATSDYQEITKSCGWTLSDVGATRGEGGTRKPMFINTAAPRGI